MLVLLTIMDLIGTYPLTLMASGCARSLESSRRQLMPVMSYRNPRQLSHRVSSCRQGAAVRCAWWDAPITRGNSAEDWLIALF